MHMLFQRFRLQTRKPRVESLGLVVFLASILSPLGADEISRSPKDESPALQAAAALYDGIRTETLPNGFDWFPIPKLLQFSHELTSVSCFVQS